jgi:hypothetical protein
MSVLDNRRAKEDLGLTFMGFDDYLPELVELFADPALDAPESYVRQREREIALAA